MKRVRSDSDVSRRFVSIEGDHDTSASSRDRIGRNFQLTGSRNNGHRNLVTPLPADRYFVVSVKFLLTGVVKRL